MKLDVRIEELPSLRVACAQGFGPEPETLALDNLLSWAKGRGLFAVTPKPRLFGFNCSGSSAGGPDEGYEVWLTVAPQVEGHADIVVKEFAGGLYAVTRCEDITEPASEIPARWEQLAAWVKRSPYRPAHHQWLEEHLSPAAAGSGPFALDLYLPIRRA